jgi:AraC-like DNA-binding protein
LHEGIGSQLTVECLDTNVQWQLGEVGPKLTSLDVATGDIAMNAMVKTIRGTHPASLQVNDGSIMNTLPEMPGLREAVENLLGNVCRFNRPVGRVRILLEASPECIELTVERDRMINCSDDNRFVVQLPAIRENAVRGGLTAWKLRRVLQFITENLDRPITVEEIAAIARQSESHFHRSFKRSLGTTVHLYVMSRRIEMAQQLMINTSEPLSRIALACGMCDQSHLTRWFTRLSGESPNQWRRSRMDSEETANVAPGSSFGVARGRGYHLLQIAPPHDCIIEKRCHEFQNQTSI